MPKLCDMISAYARALGRLLHDIESGVSMDAISASLAAATRRSRPRTVEIALTDGALVVDGAAIDGAETPEAESLRLALTRHHVTGAKLKVGITPRELLQLAAMLAEKENDASVPSVFDAARRLGFWHIELSGEQSAAQATAFSPPVPFPLSTLDEAEKQIVSLTNGLVQTVEQQYATGVATSMYRALLTVNNAIAAGSGESTDAPLIAERWRQCYTTMATAPALQLLTSMLVADGFSREPLIAMLRHAGNAGTAALMDQLTVAGTVFHRRVFFDAIVELGVGTSVLIAHLSHPQWYVVRNAAALLGAMRSPDAEFALIKLLSHPDERVRVSVATALIQLGTPSGRKALENAINDTSSQVRRRILEALLKGDGVLMSAAVISEALDLERDPEVQLEIVASLRAMATPHAVQQLVRLCSPAGSANKSAAFQRAAIEALTALNPTAAAPFLRIRSHDRDTEVREHATALLRGNSQAA